MIIARNRVLLDPQGFDSIGQDVIVIAYTAWMRLASEIALPGVILRLYNPSVFEVNIAHRPITPWCDVCTEISRDWLTHSLSNHLNLERGTVQSLPDWPIGLYTIYSISKFVTTWICFRWGKVYICRVAQAYRNWVSHTTSMLAGNRRSMAWGNTPAGIRTTTSQRAYSTILATLNAT